MNLARAEIHPELLILLTIVQFELNVVNRVDANCQLASTALSITSDMAAWNNK
jgi:hypothetical protein